MPPLPSILMITHGLGPEGAPRYLVNLAKSLVETGQWHIAVFSHTDGPLRADLAAAGIDLFIAPIRQRQAADQKPAEASDMERYCRDNLRFLDLSSKAAFRNSIAATGEYISRTSGFTPDIVLSNTVLGFWGLELARMWNLPSVWCIHESEPPFSHLQWLPPELFAILPDLLARTSRVIFAAKATMDVFAEAGHSFAGEVIHPGLPPDMPVFAAPRLDRQKIRAEVGIADTSVCFLALGSVFERKGQTDICRAMARLPEPVLHNARCRVIGDRPGTPYSAVLHGCINTLPSPAREAIRVFPETLDIAPHYRAADVFVLCSRMESYPLVILEAMSLGLPIITTPVFGVQEQLTEQSALFYEPGDIDALAGHIALLATDADTRRAFGRKALLRYSELPSYRDMATAYHKLIADIQRGTTDI